MEYTRHLTHCSKCNATVYVSTTDSESKQTSQYIYDAEPTFTENVVEEIICKKCSMPTKAEKLAARANNKKGR